MAKKKEQDRRRELHELAAKVAEPIESDVIVYAGGMYTRGDNRFNRMIRSFAKDGLARPNAILILTTFGGMADSAFRIARCLQEVYKNGTIRVFVDSFCKSAGTLVALGADEIVMSECAEFGPLDVQIQKPDEIDERLSGLTPTQALSTLQSEAYNAFEQFFVRLRRRTHISSKIAADVAAQLTIGMFSPIYSQIEPMRLGENQRAMNVAEQYGQRLSELSEILNPKGLERLLGGYPSHEFVIDRSEAGEIFSNIRSPSSEELELADAIRETTISYAVSGAEDETSSPLIDVLSYDERSEGNDRTQSTRKQPAAEPRPVPQDQGEADGASHAPARNSNKKRKAVSPDTVQVDGVGRPR